MFTCLICCSLFPFVDDLPCKRKALLLPCHSPASSPNPLHVLPPATPHVLAAIDTSARHPRRISLATLTEQRRHPTRKSYSPSIWAPKPSNNQVTTQPGDHIDDLAPTVEPVYPVIPPSQATARSPV
ncbi:hypothetical protein BN1708_008556 [Verticillium longisporum]|uniref:Uncharacterized protein n=1 Tax=Verticillium longisporum TaxID=100787 RepID=A0A0G4N570_VERLO|nr:hypothetical protein BN1708_008556 [Verticillium longisporum]